MTRARTVRGLSITAIVVIAVGVVAVVVLRRGTDAADGNDLGSRSCSRETPDPAADRWVTRDGTQLRLNGRQWRFTGANVFWLGLRDGEGGSTSYPSDDETDDALAAARAAGMGIVRSTTLGVSVGTANSIEPALGRFNDKAFGPIDHAVAQARRCGLRLMIPLTDQHHYYHGGKSTFTNWLGYPNITGAGLDNPTQRAREGAFYTDARVVDAFHDYVAHVLDHRNPLTGLRLGDDPTIAVWETGNEVWDAPTAWTGQTATFIKSHAPRALVADGSTSSNADVAASGVDQADIDLVDAHYYPTSVAKMDSDAAYVAAKGKAFVVGEYPLTGSGLSPWLAALGANRAVAGDLAWSLLPYDAAGDPEPHDDGYTFHLPGATADERRQVAALETHARMMRRSVR